MGFVSSLAGSTSKRYNLNQPEVREAERGGPRSSHRKLQTLWNCIIIEISTKSISHWFTTFHTKLGSSRITLSPKCAHCTWYILFTKNIYYLQSFFVNKFWMNNERRLKLFEYCSRSLWKHISRSSSFFRVSCFFLDFY